MQPLYKGKGLEPSTGAIDTQLFNSKEYIEVGDNLVDETILTYQDAVSFFNALSSGLSTWLKDTLL